MGEPTASGDAQFLWDYADHLDPDFPSPMNAAVAAMPSQDIAAQLRRIAQQLDRIATGGDRPPPTE